MLKPEFEEVQLGTAEVREVFRVPKIGNVAGSLVRSGTIVRNSKARLIRDGAVVADNLSVESLRRFKDDATEVRERSEEHTSELQSRQYLVCRLLLEKKTKLAF